MEERYEIREKIGQGGIGSVHRAYDHKISRHVAIKRIVPRGGDPKHEAEATKQMMAEVGALSSLQHPHIVTVFDVGSDEDGPYVVMELIDGKTLDEISENAPLTWDDFKIVAMQSLEALIAAHDLDMIHSDLKPPNIMLSWMPSGAFQIKIVDFGLATMIHNQSQEELEKMEAVYGSVFFMPPEQFERKVLDVRSDLYSLGCCFYQALAGSCPFDGDTGPGVMHAHLNHVVNPLEEIRGDIPPWASTWVMWMINRDPDDRPATARDALAVFLQHERLAKAAAAQGRPSPAGGAAPAAQAAAGDLSDAPEAVAAPTAAVHLGANKPGKTKSHKKGLGIALSAAGVVVLVLAIWLMTKRNEGIRAKNAYNSIFAMAAKKDVKKVHLSSGQLKLVFDYITSSEPDANLAPAYEALTKATASDGSDFDAAIAGFATTAALPVGIRRELFEEVIVNRGSTAAVPILIGYSASAKGAEEAAAALDAIRPMIREEHAGELLELIATTTHANVRQTAESAMSHIIASSRSREDLAALISNVGKKADQQAARPLLDRLLAQCKAKDQVTAQVRPPAGGQSPAKPKEKPKPNRPPPPKAPESWRETMDAFDASDDAGKLEIIATLAGKPEGHSHGALREIAASPHAHLKPRAIQALVELNSHPEMAGPDVKMRQHWLQIIWRCDTHEQKIMVIDGLAKFRAEWAKVLIGEMSRGADNPTTLHARKALQELK